VDKVNIDGESLTIEDVVHVARHDVQVEVSQEAMRRVAKCRETLDKLIKENKVIYGVTTGFGFLAGVAITPEESKELQINLIRSHSSAIGKPLGRDAVRALMLLRANTMAKGYSGVRLETLETLVKMLNKKVHPLIPEKGSVGASGDLSALSHMALVMLGEGQAELNGRTMGGLEAMKKAGIDILELEAKEGLALNNGTQLMTALGALTIHDAEQLIRTAEIISAMSMEALGAILDAFDNRIHRARAHEGQTVTARNILVLTAGSDMVMTSSRMMKEASEKIGVGRLPHDPYTIRCIPQVFGMARDTIKHAKKIIEVEINSATDNPLIFPEDNECLSGGNFHGQPIAAAMDFLSIALSAIGNMSERRISRLLDPTANNGLPTFLIHKDVKKGLHSGFMSSQFTAAALASENKALAHPASVDSIPTSASFEDFVSMGPAAARKASEILRNVQYILAIELLCAAQGIDLRRPKTLGRGTGKAYELLREKVPVLKEDRAIHEDIEQSAELIRSESILSYVEQAVGKLF